MSTTVAKQLLEDPKVIEAQKTLVESLKTYQARLTGVEPPKEDLTTSYQETIEAFSKIRAGALYFPYLGSGLGRGPLVELADGSVKYDMINGIGVHHFGHSHPEIVAAMIEAALGDVVMQGNLQQHQASYEFSRDLLQAAQSRGAQLAHCFLSSTGVMAGENCLKLALQKHYPAHRLLAFEGCFSGRTIAFSSITDKAAYRVGLPQAIQVDYVPFYDPKHPKESTERAAAVLESHLKRYPGKYAAMFFELILGEGGFYPGSSDFHRRLMEICRKNKVAVLVDEVQTFARTPELFAFQYFELDEWVDAVWIGKASQVCASFFRADYAPKPGLLSQTFTAGSSAIAAGQVILRHLIEGNYFGASGKIQKTYESVVKRMEAIASRHPDLLEGPYGLGAMVACTPLQGDVSKVKVLIEKLFHHGVIAFLAGAQPARVRFLLPIGAIEEHHLDEIFAIFEKTLIEVSKD